MSAGEAPTRFVYRFGGGASDGAEGDKILLGGKGANLDEMARIGLPVPPGFTISTEMCAVYYDRKRDISGQSARRGERGARAISRR